MIQNTSQENQERYKHLQELQELANKIIRRRKRLYEKKALEYLVGVRNNPRKFFKNCKRLKQGLKPQTLFIKNYHNDLYLEPREIVQNFRKHFDTLLNTSQTNSSNRITMKYEELTLSNGRTRMH